MSTRWYDRVARLFAIVLALVLALPGSASWAMEIDPQAQPPTEKVLSVQAALGSIDKPRPPEPVQVTVNLISEPNSLGDDWPIVRSERTEYTDPKTGLRIVSRLVVRQSPPGYLGSASNCPDPAKTPGLASPLLACGQNGDKIVEADSTLGGLTIHVKSFAHRYCDNGICQWYQPYELDVWWTRTSTSWSAQNALVYWGCYACTICGGGGYECVWSGSSFTPNWQTSTRTVTYQHLSSNFPAMYPFDGTGDRASGENDAWQNFTYMGHMSVNSG